MSNDGARVSLGRIFRVFALIGVTSFGGGIVAYLRHALVEKEKWLDAEEFMAALEISQTLPGLNSTNMSVIVGRKLRGAIGAVVATLGMILPGAAIVMALGFAYARFRHDPAVAAVLFPMTWKKLKRSVGAYRPSRFGESVGPFSFGRP